VTVTFMNITFRTVISIILPDITIIHTVISIILTVISIILPVISSWKIIREGLSPYPGYRI
jgi:hypothetical protein